MNDEIVALLGRLTAGTLTPEELAAEVAKLQRAVWATHPTGSALLDLGREQRTGIEEVVFAEGKSTEALVTAVRGLLDTRGRVLVTRLRAEQHEPLAASCPELTLHSAARVAVGGAPPAALPGVIGVVSAGTSDAAIADEAALTAQYFGARVARFTDIGVAGLGRLMDALPDLRAVDVLVVVAGMEGALPGVVAGLVRAPVVAVPASVGYGASWGGITPLFSMLASCSPGITVVNIDNGFGAAVAAVKMIRHLKTSVAV